MNQKAFTLVELIVVMTTLAILWTISFLSFQGYSKEARDSKRITDTRNLLGKINIEMTRWAYLPRLVANTTQATLKILWTNNQWVETFWISNFENLKELWDNFKDPSNWNDYPVAYVIGWIWNEAYQFVQIATISEADNRTKIFGNYYKKEYDDAPSLFLTWGAIYTESGSIIYEDNWSNLIYDVNDDNSDDEWNQISWWDNNSEPNWDETSWWDSASWRNESEPYNGVPTWQDPTTWYIWEANSNPAKYEWATSTNAVEPTWKWTEYDIDVWTDPANSAYPAFAYCRSLWALWRLPTKDELETLVDTTKHFAKTNHPTLSTNIYWSGTQDTSSSNSAWYVHFNTGHADSTGKPSVNQVVCIYD